MGPLQEALTSLNNIPLSLQFAIGALVAYLLYAFLTRDVPYPGIPLATVKRQGWETLLPAKHAWISHANEILAKGASQYPGIFQVLTSTGYKIVIPNRFADELKTHPNLNFNLAFRPDFFVDYPGFEGQREGLKDETFISEVVRVKLTQSLGLVTDDLVDETQDALSRRLGDNPEWETHQIKDDMLDVIARLSARVFLGKELCRNLDWLEISKRYTIDTFMGSFTLRMFPRFMVPIVFWLIPQTNGLRKQVATARRIIMPEVERRVARAEKALEAGEKIPKSADAIGWMVEVSKLRNRPVDYVAGQLSLTSAAIHTTTEATASSILQLCETPEIVEPLREEVIQVLKSDGWSKTSLYKMRLMDSFLKEVQRVKNAASLSMNRYVLKDVTLSDGSVLPAGARTFVMENSKDPKIYDEPAKFDPSRFVNMRQRAGEENRHQFVSTAAEQMGFGHGQHACPGRFFASNEIKIALSFMLLRYDFRFAPDIERAPKFMFETGSMVNPKTMIQVRRRREEIDLLNPQQVK